MVYRVRDYEGAVEGERSVLRFSEVVRGLACDLAPIYGEEVALRDDGRSDFGALMAKRGGLMR
jgi:hypothetical protein